MNVIAISDPKLLLTEFAYWASDRAKPEAEASYLKRYGHAPKHAFLLRNVYFMVIE